LLTSLERLRGARKPGADRGWQGLSSGFLYIVHGRPEGHAGRQVEREGYGRQLATVIHTERSDVIRRGGDRGQRNQLAGLRAQVQQLKRRRIPLVFVQQLENPTVLVVRCVDRR